mgnify:CR=1 FL=1
MAVEFVKFKTSYKTYDIAGAILREEDTLGYHFINTGDVICWINGFPLYPSGVLDTMISGYQDTSLYTIKFDNSISPTPNPELGVITFNRA